MITRASHQLWVLSTAGDGRSKYLWRKTLAGRNACETGEHGRTAYFEWSAPDDADPSDPETWWGCMPALGITITERTIEGEWAKAVRGGQEGIDKFRRSYLNQWPDVPLLDEEAARTDLDVGSWLNLADPAAPRGANPVFGVDIGVDRLAHVAVAWRRPDGDVQVMLADSGLSPLRTASRVQEIQSRWKGRVMLGGTAASLEGDVKNSEVVSSSEFAAACGRFDDLFRDGEIHHGNQDPLNVAVKAAKWRSFGTAGERSLQLKDAPTVGPLAAVVRALHGLLAVPEVKVAKPKAERAAAVPRGGDDLASMGF
jgi:phage terminase large subunit-like protein